MKKFFSILCTAIIAVGMAFGISACNSSSQGYSVYAPDGAPALSLAQICASDNSKFEVNIVNATTIQTYVSGENSTADFAIMPVNAAVKLLGDGNRYKMLGTVTHGNLFLLKKQNGVAITAENLSTLVGKTVGVINLANVPGLMFKVILSQNDIQYNQLSDGSEVASDKVNLKNVQATEVIPSNSSCDYFVVPEPAASTKINATQGKLSLSASLQTLYGEEEGYPQAVAIAKTSIIEKDERAVEEFISALQANERWINDENTSAESVVNAITPRLVGGIAPTFTAKNLSKTVIANCGIKFVANANGKEAVISIMQKLNSVSTAPWGTPSNDFFYGI